LGRRKKKIAKRGRIWKEIQRRKRKKQWEGRIRRNKGENEGGTVKGRRKQRYEYRERIRLRER
jgi:hypothetical protein